jgi:hypothetical protein
MRVHEMRDVLVSNEFFYLSTLKFVVSTVLSQRAPCATRQEDTPPHSGFILLFVIPC